MTNNLPQNEFSIVRALNNLAQSRPVSGLEREVSDSIGKIARRDSGGFFLPSSFRDLNASGTAIYGGNTVQTDVPGGSFIELLQNESVCFKLGARRLTGLVGDVAIPSGASGATAYWVAENAQTTPSTPTFGQVGLTPHRLSASCVISKRLLAQSSIDVEGFVRRHLAEIVATEVDRVCLAGTGADGEPTGILTTNSVGSVTFGAAITQAKLIDFETAIAQANALTGAIAFVVSPATRSKLKTKPMIGDVYPRFLWETSTGPTGNKVIGSEGTVTGYKAVATNQLSSTHQVIFGNWQDLIIADWVGLDVTTDPYTLADKHQLKVTVNMLVDVAVRHPGSFAISSDSGAQ